ncbi:MAG: hypothetical protein QGH19_03150 [Candidatus Woesearchaeota archaeon]|nr:hypothetical protein [Candidatus Woesearchaeota archaeon]
MRKGKPEIIFSLIFGILSKFFAYFLLLVFANLYSQEELGAALFILSIFNLTLNLSSLGMPFIYVSWLIKKKDIYSVFSFLLILNIIIFLVALAFSASHPWIFPLALILPLVYLFNTSISILNSKYQYHLSKLFSSLIVLFCILFAFLLRNLERLGITASYSISYIIITSIVIFLTRKKLFNILSNLTLNLTSLTEYLKKSIFVSLLTVSFTILYWSDSIILGLLSTFENVAKYNIAGHMSNIITIIPISLSLFLLNRSAEYSTPEHQKWSFGVLNRNLRLSFAFTITLAITLSSLLTLLTKIFFPKYIGIEPFVMLLSIGLIFFSIYHLIYMYLAGKLHPEKAFFPIATAAILNIILDIILIPIAGIYGIVIATLTAHMLAFTWLTLKMGLLRKYSPIYILILLIPLSYILKAYGLILLIIIIPLLFYFKLIEKEDITVIINTLRRKSK